MTERRFVIVLNVGIFVLLVVLVMEAAGMRRSLRRIEREERGLVHGQANHFQVSNSADSLWRNATDGAWILVPWGSSSSSTCSNCRGPLYHRFFTKEGCEGALAEWNYALNAYAIGQLGTCEMHPLKSSKVPGGTGPTRESSPRFWG